MLNFMEVLRGMFILRRVTAAHVPASQAEPQMYPGIAGFHALFAHVLAGLPDFDLVEMGALMSHILSPKRGIVRVK
jgi:hypothetical protein